MNAKVTAKMFLKYKKVRSFKKNHEAEKSKKT